VGNLPADVLALLVDGPDATLNAEGSHDTVVLPDDLRLLLRWLAERQRQGQTVTVRSHGPESSHLSTQEAADLLGVSRPTLVKWLDAGVLPSQRPGTHRQVRRADVLAHLTHRELAQSDGRSAPGRARDVTPARARQTAP